MEKVDGHKLVNFASHVDDNTIEQAKETAAMPFVHPHVALMPDAHSGKGSAVGTVIPTLDAVIPAAVGVDIGCGMIAARTVYTESDLAGRDLAALRRADRGRDPAVAGQLQRRHRPVPVHSGTRRPARGARRAELGRVEPLEHLA